MLIIASIETLKRQKSQCGIYEVFKLVKDTIEENITREIFDKTLDSLIESGSVKSSRISNKTYLSLRKDNVIDNENFNNFKEDLNEDFDKLKETFFAEVKSFEDKLLDSFENVVDSPTDGSKIFTAHILEEVYFLWKQLKSKDEMINSLLNQLAKCNDMLQLQQSNQSSSSSSSTSLLSSLSPWLSSSSSSLSSLSPSSSSSSSSNLLPTPEKIGKKIQKNNVKNTVTKEHVRVGKENDVSNATNSTKTNENKEDQNKNNEVKSVDLIGNNMMKHLNGWDMLNGWVM